MWESENDGLADPGGVAFEETTNESLDGSSAGSQFWIIQSYIEKIKVTAWKAQKHFMQPSSNRTRNIKRMPSSVAAGTKEN